MGASVIDHADLQRIMGKLADAETQAQALRDEVTSVRALESNYRATILGQEQKLIRLSKELSGARASQDELSQARARIDDLTRENAGLREQVSAASDEHRAVVNSYDDEIARLNRQVEASDVRWRSELATVRTDLAHKRRETSEKIRVYEEATSAQNDISARIREKSQAAIDELRQEIDNRERQEAALRMQLDAALVGRKALADDLDKVKEELEQVRGEAQEHRIQRAIEARKQVRLIADLRNQLRRQTLSTARLQQQLQFVTASDHSPAASDARSIEGDRQTICNAGSDVADTDLSATLPASPSLMSTIHPDEPSVLRECNASLIDKLASSQDQIATLKKQLSTTKHALARSRGEVNNYIRRVQSGALTLAPADKMPSKSLNGVAWSNASERVDLFRRMELVLQETTLQNSILTEEKAALGRKILELTANANASERPIA
ncbi:Uncharacterized protein PBTT_04273 [Plasmodiophora brassicae]|uniref:Uncharacterized protein n=1 Tax=Plasmodiophora brassicae TaxID=37360 RepID=A0A0G4IGN8_PLABS|nr:hypothetical protein PBRA_000148 [Plasmodiophora brassicae]